MTDKIAPNIRKRRPPFPVKPGDPKPSADTYDIGYGKPPRHSQFKKGVSGNPRGRPKEAKGVKTIVRDVLESKVAVQMASGPKRMSKLELAIHKQVEKACKGDLRAFVAVLKHYDNGDSSKAGGSHVGQISHALSATDVEILKRFRDETLAAAHSGLEVQS
jgi:hypothetical protein